jgi:uncharacterized protein
VVQLSELHTLARAECLELLRTVTMGRIAFAERGLPAIQPVNFTVDGSNVIIRTSGGGKLAAAVTGAMVAFEADEVDAATRTGWSVVVLGHARLIRNIDQLVALPGPTVTRGSRAPAATSSASNPNGSRAGASCRAEQDQGLSRWSGVAKVRCLATATGS